MFTICLEAYSSNILLGNKGCEKSLTLIVTMNCLMTILSASTVSVRSLLRLFTPLLINSLAATKFDKQRRTSTTRKVIGPPTACAIIATLTCCAAAYYEIIHGGRK
jgi:hypothetical protein